MELVLFSRVLLVIFIYGLLGLFLLNVLSTWGFTSVLLSLFPQLLHTAVLNTVFVPPHTVTFLLYTFLPLGGDRLAFEIKALS